MVQGATGSAGWASARGNIRHYVLIGTTGPAASARPGRVSPA
jgi:hypothetical protein